MVSDLKLPLEVLQTIFSKLESKYLFHCQRVCKTWKPHAQQFCYEQVRLTNYKQQPLIFKTFHTVAGLGNMVRLIDLHDL